MVSGYYAYLTTPTAQLCSVVAAPVVGAHIGTFRKSQFKFDGRSGGNVCEREHSNGSTRNGQLDALRVWLTTFRHVQMPCELRTWRSRGEV